MITRLLGLNQYGIFITYLDGHIWLNWEEDFDLSPTDHSKELLEKLSNHGISIRYKQYGSLEEVLDRIDKVLTMMDMDTLENVGSMVQITKLM